MDIEVNNKNFTSLEQSKKMLQLRINPITADCKLVDGTPSWSLGALIKLLSCGASLHVNHIEPVYKVTFDGEHDKKGNRYPPNPWFDTPFEAVYNAVIWLLENDCIRESCKRN